MRRNVVSVLLALAVLASGCWRLESVRITRTRVVNQWPDMPVQAHELEFKLEGNHVVEHSNGFCWRAVNWDQVYQGEATYRARGSTMAIASVLTLGLAYIVWWSGGRHRTRTEPVNAKRTHRAWGERTVDQRECNDTLSGIAYEGTVSVTTCWADGGCETQKKTFDRFSEGTVLDENDVQRISTIGEFCGDAKVTLHDPKAVERPLPESIPEPTTNASVALTRVPPARSRGPVAYWVGPADLTVTVPALQRLLDNELLTASGRAKQLGDVAAACQQRKADIIVCRMKVNQRDQKACHERCMSEGTPACAKSETACDSLATDSDERTLCQMTLTPACVASSGKDVPQCVNDCIVKQQDAECH